MHSFPEHPESSEPEDISTVLTTLSKTTQREGLPAGFRMRADAHYVDQLDAPVATSIRLVAVDSIEDDSEQPNASSLQDLTDSIRRHGVLQPLLVQGGRRAAAYRLIEGRRRLAAARLGGLKQIPCIVHAVDDSVAEELRAAARQQVTAASEGAVGDMESAANTAAAGRDLHEALVGIVSSLPFLANRSAATRGVASQAIAAEAQRALSLLTAIRVLRDEIAFARTPVSARNVIEQAIGATRPFTTGRTGRAQSQPDAVLLANEELLLAAINGVSAALGMMVDSGTGVPAEVSAGHDPDARIVTFAVRQPGPAIPAPWLRQAFEHPWPVQSGLAALVLLQSAQHVAELHGGQASITGDHLSTTVAIRIPTADPTN